MIRDMQDKILALKKEKDICILAHSYQNRDIVEVADLVGDSFALSVQAAKVPQKTVIMCGVRFMAETVKILSPEKTVILANPDAGCLMADQMNKERIEQIKREHPDYAVVAYINTTSELKTVCDVCVTSSSAVKIVKAMEQKNILLAQIANDPANAKKPDAIKEKMVQGRISKFYDNNCLVDMTYVKDEDMKVGKYVESVAKELGGHIAIVEFFRFEKGEGIQKREENFAEEIAKMTAGK